MKRCTWVSLAVLMTAMTIAPASQAEVTTLDGAHPSVRYLGSWQSVADTEVAGGSVMVSRQPGATATVRFYGTGLAWLSYGCPCAGRYARVLVDGNVVDTVTAYYDGTHPFREIWRIDNLAYGEHVVTVEVTDESTSENTYVVVDAFRVTDPLDSNVAWFERPTAIFTAPADQSLVTGAVNLAVDASDNVGVTRVRFYANHQLLEEDREPPFTFSRDVSTLPSGLSVGLWARAFDAAGNVGISNGVTITIQHEDRTRPTVTLTSPASGSTATGVITLAANASDDRGIGGVGFYAPRGQRFVTIGTDTTPPYALMVNTDSLPEDSSQTIYALAWDTAGNLSTPPGVAIPGPVTVVIDNSDIPGRIRVDTTDPAVTFGEVTWVTTNDFSRIGKVYHWGSARYAGTHGHSVRLTFTGTRARWLGVRCSTCGVATVSIDGGAATTVDTMGSHPWQQFGQRVEAVYETPLLPYGNHTLDITVEDPANDRGIVVVDAFEVFD